MATVNELLSRIRLDLGDPPRAFVFTAIGDGATKTFDLEARPVSATSLVVKVASVTVTTGFTIDESAGQITFTSAPALNASVIIAGTQYRYFTDSDLTTFIDSATALHINGRVDSHGIPLTLATLPAVESSLLSKRAAIEALWALVTDAAFDIDIHAPDGISIPRSERFRQLMMLIDVLTARYKEESELLGVGIYAVEVFTLRRVSLGTNRYVPVYLPQEYDDRTPPVRAEISAPTYGSQARPEMLSTYTINLYQGNAWVADFDFPFALTNKVLTAKIRGYVGSTTVLAEITCEITDGPAGIARLSLTKEQTKALPEDSVWDLVITDAIDTTITETYMKGSVYTERSVSP